MGVTSEHEWREAAACKGAPLDIFYDHAEGQLRSDWERAASMCQRCEVTDECLQEAIDIVDWWSYRAGMSPIERLRMLDNRYEDRTPEEATRLYRRLLGRLRGSVEAAVPEEAIGVHR